MFGQYIEGILWLDTRVCRTCANRSAITEVGKLLKRHTLVPSPTILLHSVAWLKKAGETVLNVTVATSPPGHHSQVESPARGYCAQNSAYVKKRDNPILEMDHDKGKCTLFYCCFGHYRKLAYKISACEVCMICRKPTEACKNPLPIAESMIGKPAIVTLKIQSDSSTVHDTFLYANIYVRSH